MSTPARSTKLDSRISPSQNVLVSTAPSVYYCTGSRFNEGLASLLRAIFGRSVEVLRLSYLGSVACHMWSVQAVLR